MKGKASVYIAGDIAEVVPGVKVAEVATLILALIEVLRNCRGVDSAEDAANWLNSLGSKDGRRRRTINEIGRLWRGRLTHYDKLEQAVLTRCLVVTKDEMTGLFSELISGTCNAD